MIMRMQFKILILNMPHFFQGCGAQNMQKTI